MLVVVATIISREREVHLRSEMQFKRGPDLAWKSLDELEELVHNTGYVQQGAEFTD